tara:strand:- start:4157 stop:4288 length:132 start_codon:yes stop_codon:yes gene_type:complete
MPIEYNVDKDAVDPKQQILGVLVLVGVCALLLFIVYRVSRRKK